MSDTDARRSGPSGAAAGGFAAWAGLLPPVAWAVHLSASYALATLHCEGSAWPGLALSAVLLLAAAFGTLVSWRRHPAFREPDDAALDLGSGDWRRFLAWSAVAFGVLFTCAILVQSFPFFVLRPCE